MQINNSVPSRSLYHFEALCVTPVSRVRERRLLGRKAGVGRHENLRIKDGGGTLDD